MTRKKQTLSRVEEKKSPKKVSLGYDYQYPIKGIGEESYKLDFGTPMKIKEFLYLPGLKKNLLSISTLDKKGLDKCLCGPKENQLKMQLSLVKKKEDYIKSRYI